MDKVYEISLLMDFYGQLLTERQLEILDLHYNNDYSLGEIAEQLGISRQGVYDNVKRGKTVLNEMESKLGLVRKFSEQKSKAQELLSYVRNVRNNKTEDKFNNDLEHIESVINDIINSI